MTAHSLSNELLKYERERRNWTQGDVAEKIGAPDPKMVGKWERGITTPQSQYVRKLAELFEKSARELGITRGDEIPFWNVPYRQNPFFTGREDIIARLHKERTDLKSEYSPRFQAQAICGLGGVGKTQTAVEYAYRYRDQYQAVLWVRADTREVLASDFASLAVLLNLPEKNEQHQHRVMLAVKSWLASLSRWLLIFDNADELQSVNDYIPSPCQGHLLLTTRTCVTGNLAQSISIDTMEPEEGAYFLLRRARMIELQTACEGIAKAIYNQARTISQILGGLPLALDKAGAYIEETRCSLPDYLHLYETQRGNLLRWRGEFAEDHPAPVATTWALSFDKIRQANPFAIELLRLCAFLAPDAIPEEILTVGAPDLGPALQAITTNPFKLDVVFKELLKFSLIRRDPTAKTLTIHRLVQTVLRDRMDQDTQLHWAERAVKAVYRVFPNVEFATWSFCQRYLPHAQSCAELIKQWGMQFPEAIQLLDLCGQYLYQRAQYAEAEALYRQALELREQALGPEHPDVAISLSNLTSLYWDQGKFMQVEPLFLRALAVRTQALGPEHPDVATILNNLALLYYSQQMFDQSESLFQRALTINEQTLGLEHPQMAITWQNYARLLQATARYDQAAEFEARATALWNRRTQNLPTVTVPTGNPP